MCHSRRFIDAGQITSIYIVSQIEENVKHIMTKTAPRKERSIEQVLSAPCFKGFKFLPGVVAFFKQLDPDIRMYG